MDPRLDTLPPQEPSSFKKLLENLSSVGHSRILSMLFLLLVVAAVPLTVFVAQQQQETRQQASGRGNPESVRVTCYYKGTSDTPLADSGSPVVLELILEHPAGANNSENYYVLSLSNGTTFANIIGTLHGLRASIQEEDRDATLIYKKYAKAGNFILEGDVPYQCPRTRYRPGDPILGGYVVSEKTCSGENDISTCTSPCTDSKCSPAIPNKWLCAYKNKPVGNVCKPTDDGTGKPEGVCDNRGTCRVPAVPTQPDDPPPPAATCGKECKYTQADPNGGAAKCYLGNCADGSQNCGTAVNTNCKYVEGCSKGTVVSCSPAVSPVSSPRPVVGGNPGTGGGVNPTAPPVANKGKCEGEIKAECGNPNKLIAKWTVEGVNGKCNVFLQAGETEAISSDCSGTKEITKFKGSDPDNIVGNDIKNGEVYKLFVSNGGRCLNELGDTATVACTAAGNPQVGRNCRDLLPSETNPKTGVPDDKYTWQANCQKTCQGNTDCPTNTTQTGVVPATSNWCYSFEDGKKCMQLRADKTSPPVPVVSTPVPTGFPRNDFNNSLAKICSTSTNCVNGTLSCTGNECEFIKDTGGKVSCDRSKLGTDDCKIFPRNATLAPKPAPLPEESWWCKLMKNTPFKCNESGVSETKQQVPQNKDGLGVGWFNPFGW